MTDTNDPGIAMPLIPAMARQGDVLLVPVTAVPESATAVARDRGRVVLAYGEVTGHAHVVASAGATQLAYADDRYLRLREAATLTHEEHSPIALAPGAYRVV